MSAVVLRVCGEADRPALRRLAERDSTLPPAGIVLGAEADGELRAAICLATRRVIADPFQPTTELVELLHTRAAQLGTARNRGTGRHVVGRIRRALRSSERRSLDAPLPSPGS